MAVNGCVTVSEVFFYVLDAKVYHMALFRVLNVSHHGPASVSNVVGCYGEAEGERAWSCTTELTATETR